MAQKFHIGDIVEVISDTAKTRGAVGEVQGYTSSYYNSIVKVYLPSTQSLNNYCESSLKISQQALEDNKVVGNYKIAGINFMDGTNLNKEYYFALFDDFEKDDIVVCDTVNGYRLGKLISIKSKDEIESIKSIKEIVCRVDFSYYNERKLKRGKAAKIKALMDKRVKELQDVALFEMMSEKDESLKEMLLEYKELIH